MCYDGIPTGVLAVLDSYRHHSDYNGLFRCGVFYSELEMSLGLIERKYEYKRNWRNSSADQEGPQ